MRVVHFIVRMGLLSAGLTAAALAAPLLLRGEVTREYLPMVELVDSVALYRMPEDAMSMVIEVRGSLPGDKEGFAPSKREWGLVWDTDSTLTSGSYVSLNSFRTNHGDPTDRQGLRATFGTLGSTPGSVSTQHTDIVTGVNDTGAPNTLIVELSDTMARIFAGNSRLSPVATMRRNRECGNLWGIRANSRWKSTLIVTESEPNPASQLQTDWTRDSLENYLNRSTDPCEGIWRYLDRVNDPALGRPGGAYLLATVSDGRDGYDVIYLDGARVWASRWKPLMVKGHLSPTGFAGEYDLTWYDATMCAATTARDECSATLTPSALLEVRFPLHATTLRFAREGVGKSADGGEGL